MTASGPDPADELRARAEAAVPPMSLDPAVVLAHGRRRVRRRTVATGAGGLLACAAVLAVMAGAVGRDAPSGYDAIAAPSPATTGTTSPTTGATAVPTLRTLAPGVVAPSGRLSADELGQVDLGAWDGVPVWLADGELHVQADSDDAVSASRSTGDARVEILAPGSARQGVYLWGTAPHDGPGAVPYLWTTARPTGSPDSGPLVVRVPTFEVAGVAGGAPQWAAGVFGTDVDISDTSQIGVVFRSEDGTLSTPGCPDLAARTCMDPLPPTVAAAVATATGSAAAPSSGTGNGHTDPDTQDRRLQTRADALMQTMADAVGDGDEGDPDAYWTTLDHRLDTLVTDAETQGFSRGDDGARVVELGFFTYPGFLRGRSAEWVGWLDGERVTVSLEGESGRLRYVEPGAGGGRVDVVLPSDGARLVDVVTHAYDEYLVGSVLGFTDTKGRDHHLDLLTRTWLD